MKITQSICPRCGSSSDNGNLCNTCLVQETEWVTCDPRIILIRCQSCGSIKHQSSWSDELCDREDIEYKSAVSAVHLHADLAFPKIEIQLERNSENRTFAHLKVCGMLYGIPVEKEYTTELLWQSEACDRCRRLHGNYYEGIIQIRAEGRRATYEEEERSREIALLVEQELQESGDRLSFITKIDEGREGLDIVVGSQTLGEQISRTLTKRLGGRYSMHPTLVGEKEGKKLYRDLQKTGIEVLYDDRKGKSAGEKFADCDLIGIPIRLVISEKTLKQNCVELKKRSEKKTKLIKIPNIKRILN